MAKDVKIEVLYYKTSTDISLEFGLHGNYPLRLLSSNCNDIDTFFRALKRAVSRSEIIITVGGYSDQDYLPRFIAKAIGRPIVVPDYSKLGIITETKYQVPQNADPLCPKSHRFGGFLIESGPQTIISLTDDRKVRLDVVNEFIVDYITEHHNVFDTPFGVKMGKNDSTQTAVEPATEFSDIASSSETVMPAETVRRDQDTTEDGNFDTSAQDEQSQGSDNTEVADANTVVEGEPTDQASVDKSSVTEPLTDNNAKEPDPLTEDNYIPDIDTIDNIDITVLKSEALINAENTDEAVVEEPDNIETNVGADILDDTTEHIAENDNYFYEKHRTRRKKRVVRLLCIVFSLLIIICTALGDCYLSKYASADSKDFYSSLNRVYYSHGDNISAGFNDIKESNSACLTWMKFDDLSIDHPVFSVADTTDTSLLYQLPNGISDARGTLFSSCKDSVATTSENITFYGNAEVGGLFESLKSAVNDASGKTVGALFTTSDSRFSANWQIFSLFTHSSADGYDYSKTQFDDNEQYAEHLSQLQQLSVKELEREFIGNEHLLILVGIDQNERYIAVAYLKSIRVLSFSNDISYNPDSSSGSELGSSPDTSTPVTSEPTIGEAEDDNDYHGESPDILLPPPPLTSDTSSTTSEHSSSISSVTSSAASSVTSSTTASNTSSNISSVNSSQNSSTEVSSTTSSTVSSASSSTVQSSSGNTTSGTVSSTAGNSSSSSATSSTTAPKPNVDPIYTWDVELSCIDNATGKTYTGSAVSIVAMIIEDEMSPTIDPPEALIAQAVVKYNWLINNGAMNSSKPPSNALDPNPTPQAIQYATAAKGMVLMYGNTLAKTYCYAYSAGKTACYQDIWGGTAYPYLQSVDCPVDESLKDFKTSTTYSADTIKKLIADVCGINVSNMPKSEWLKPIQYDANGLYCLKISIGGKEYNGRYLRETLLAKKYTNVAAIRSTAYEIVYNESDDTFTVTCKGYGHGVGFSQRGAKAYALQGWTCEQLLAHFFPGTTLIKN